MDVRKRTGVLLTVHSVRLCVWVSSVHRLQRRLSTVEVPPNCAAATQLKKLPNLPSIARQSPFATNCEGFAKAAKAAGPAIQRRRITCLRLAPHLSVSDSPAPASPPARPPCPPLPLSLSLPPSPSPFLSLARARASAGAGALCTVQCSQCVAVDLRRRGVAPVPAFHGVTRERFVIGLPSRHLAAFVVNHRARLLNTHTHTRAHAHARTPTHTHMYTHTHTHKHGSAARAQCNSPAGVDQQPAQPVAWWLAGAGTGAQAASGTRHATRNTPDTRFARGPVLGVARLPAVEPRWHSHQPRGITWLPWCRMVPSPPLLSVNCIRATHDHITHVHRGATRQEEHNTQCRQPVSPSARQPRLLRLRPRLVFARHGLAMAGGQRSMPTRMHRSVRPAKC